MGGVSILVHYFIKLKACSLFNNFKIPVNFKSYLQFYIKGVHQNALKYMEIPLKYNYYFSSSFLLQRPNQPTYFLMNIYTSLLSKSTLCFYTVLDTHRAQLTALCNITELALKIVRL